MSPMLRPLGWLYGIIADVRNSLYNRGVFKSHSLGARTISIGNITTGGTGKTPLVAYVAEILADAGEKVCILTRGYGRESSGRVLVSDGERVLVDALTGGDEPVELARKLVGKAIVVADADRVSAAKWAREKFGVTVFVLDDAFQHRRAKRDLDIVCIDATNPFGGGGVLPAGRLREPVRNLSRADAIVVTRTDQINWLDAESLIADLRRKHAHLTIFKSQYAFRHGRRLDMKQAFAFCGIGNPDSFFFMMKRAGLDPKNSMAFSDHHWYTQSDMDLVVSKAKSRDCTELVTTNKDFFRLMDRGLEIPITLSAVVIDVIIDDPDRFRDLVLSA